ncbi:glycoside hydrolase family protein [Hydrogenophaga sp.]|uniref:glycoside hydrolase family 24 protein n=1 Tax=Hydrogenophaga sp. TaxID=1904254 RepID=UPI0025BAA35C|nr:glycoside hydrolase family protein [Hydrogenophaga sp.]
MSSPNPDTFQERPPAGQAIGWGVRLLHSRLLLVTFAAALMLVLLWWWRPLMLMPGTQQLVMTGGDPHLRALMRTISAAESNVMRPYHVLHGGDAVGTLDRHPNRCEAIGQGPNRGNCSTAAGRYQLLNATWSELALRYHPHTRPGLSDASGLSFGPAYQDLVVHAWLADAASWRSDLAAQLRQGRVKPVLRRLSGTWTSLGYGIENNSMSRELPGLYQRLLKDELARAASGETPPSGDEKAAQR